MGIASGLAAGRAISSGFGEKLSLGLQIRQAREQAAADEKYRQAVLDLQKSQLAMETAKHEAIMRFLAPADAVDPLDEVTTVASQAGVAPPRISGRPASQFLSSPAFAPASDILRTSLSARRGGAYGEVLSLPDPSEERELARLALADKAHAERVSKVSGLVELLGQNPHSGPIVGQLLRNAGVLNESDAAGMTTDELDALISSLASIERAFIAPRPAGMSHSFIE